MFNIGGEWVEEESYSGLKEIAEDYYLTDGSEVEVYEHAGTATLKMAEPTLVMPRKSGKKVAK